jgi:hypothetical protein
MADQNWFTANAPAPTAPAAEPADWFAANAAPPPAPAGGSWYDHPVLGRIWRPPGVAAGQDATSKRRDSVVLGWGDNGGGVAPEDLLMLGQAGRAITGAAKLGGALGGVKEAIIQASPVIKYEATRATLRAAHVPDAIASPVAMLISGYKRGGGSAAAAETAAETQVSKPGFPKLTKTPAPAVAPPSGEGPYGSAPGFPRMTRTGAPPAPPPSGEGPYGNFPKLTRTAAPPAPPPSGEGPYGSTPGYPRVTTTPAPAAPPPSGEGPYGNFPKLTRTAAPTSPVPAMVEKVTGPYGSEPGFPRMTRTAAPPPPPPTSESPYGSAPGYPRMTRTDAPVSAPTIDFPTTDEIISGFDRGAPPSGLVQKTIVDALNGRIRQWLGGT